MITDYKNICVFCASSPNINEDYSNSAYALGALMAANGITCVCGAGRAGLMRAVADGEIENGGKVTGIIPKFMVDNGWCYDKLTTTIVTEDMHQRKEKMAQMADAVIALPGGCGTFEELLEIITWKQLGLYDGVIIILNIKGYYNPLLEMLNKSIEEHFMKASHASLWHTADTPHEAISILAQIEQEAESQIESKY